MAINVKDKLVTLESLGVAYSAEQDAREEADQALSTRIDNIVAPEGDPSLTEVSDARVSGSTTHNTLKARLDADKAAIETEISGINESLDDVKADLDNLAGAVAIKHTSINLWDENTLTSGQLFSDGSVRNVANSKYTDYISVVEGKYLIGSYQPNTGVTVRYNKNISNITAYDDQYNIIVEKGSNENVTNWIVPEGVSFVRITLRYLNQGFNFMIEMSDSNVLDTSLGHYEQYFNPYYENKDTEVIEQVEIECKKYATELVDNAIGDIELPSQLAVVSCSVEQFDGNTLQEKFYNALDTISVGIITVGNITLTEKYHPLKKDYRGITIADSVLTIGVDGWWDGSSIDSTYVYSPKFKNCVISCVGGNAIFTANSNQVIVSPTFLGCYMRKSVILKSNDIRMQSLRVMNCEFQSDTTVSYTFCKASQYWDLNFIGNRLESGKGVLFESTYTGTGLAVYHVVFRNNIIEGRDDIVLNLGSSSDIQFKENYFEHNKYPYFNIASAVNLFVFVNNYVNEGVVTNDTGCFVITNVPTDSIIEHNALLLLNGKTLVRYAQ